MYIRTADDTTISHCYLFRSIGQRRVGAGGRANIVDVVTGVHNSVFDDIVNKVDGSPHVTEDCVAIFS